MARPTRRRFDPELEVHKAWLGLLQPTGLVVVPAALVKAQVFPDKHVHELQDRARAVLGPSDGALTDLPRFVEEVLGWPLVDLAGAPGGPPLPDTLCAPLGDGLLRPTYALLDSLADGEVALLVNTVGDVDLERPDPDGASPQARMERLLRDVGVPVGLLCGHDELRLIYAPSGESSGHLGFPVAELLTVEGRPILSALHMLLSEHRVLGAADGQRLRDLLAESRRFQSAVSTRLSEQVLGALWELLRGVQAADAQARGRVLHGLAQSNPEQVYGGLLTVIMRLVFLLYAEDRGLMPKEELYVEGYSVGGLFNRLREDAGRHPDTMDQRFGAWAALLTTFRLVFDGGGHGDLRLPTRHGQLFNPDEFPFLEGRPPGVARVLGQPIDAPRVSDGVVWRVLDALLILDGERLSYRALDVEQIGSVYESMMGFEVRVTTGRSVALGKGALVDLDALLAEPPARRAARLVELAELDLPAAAQRAVAEAQTVEALVAALERRLSPETPAPLPPGTLALEPGVERRRSGSHYTPRELTGPIVRATLAPVLAALGPRPRPSQLLALKVCDPAMGSGAFLVESCRQLAEALVASWNSHKLTPTLPPDEDPQVHAQRLVAQTCLYGVDKNPFAVSLARLSLWLVTLARDHAFTFLDHALKHGDSLVGLTQAQLGAFHWSPPTRDWGPLFRGVTSSVEEARGWRREIQAASEADYDQRRAAWREAEDALADARLIGDLCVSAFFDAERDKDREALRVERHALVRAWREGKADPSALRLLVEALRGGERPITPFHWEIEFPEVLDPQSPNPGFDAIVGNPPFLGGKRISTLFGDAYRDWLITLHDGANSNTDIVAHLFRRSFNLLRDGGAFGLIATNTIGQGDTRATGLRWICAHGGEIYNATRRVMWPGMAAVVVSVVHVYRGVWSQPRTLDGHEVPKITAFLFHGGGHDDPAVLAANSGKTFQGNKIYGQGFLFDDNESQEVASSIAEMHRLVKKHPPNATRIFPYIGGQEVNTSPTHSPHRYVINFGEMSEAEAWQWPDLMSIVEAKVKPDRLTNDVRKYPRMVNEWWKYWNSRMELYRVIAGLKRVMVTAYTSKHRCFALIPAAYVYDQTLIVLPIESLGAICVLQSRIHELWSRFFGASMKDDLRYPPSDCFETFPFPPGWTDDPALEAAGRVYYERRAALMVANDEGLTKTYNRFHDPDERSPAILELRALHEAMDRAVLQAYGWGDVPTRCDFFLDYTIDEETWGDKKRPWRYRWPDEVHDEVLARLLELNARRAEEESLGQRPAKPAPAKRAAAKAPKVGRAAPKASPPKASPLGLFPTDDEG